ncbi:MAG: ABC-type transport auxiliary lipoprotein family protein [Pseudomonadota bacterium]
MTMKRRIGLLLVAIGSQTLLAGCGSGPQPQRYVLPAPPVHSSANAGDRRIVITRVQLPAYARNDSISTLQPDLTISESRDSHWASPPVESVSTVLARHIEETTHAVVALRPVSTRFDASARVAVVFDTFVRLPSNAAFVEGQFSVETTSGTAVQRFSFEEAADGLGTAGYMGATSKGLAQVARLIAEAMKSDQH